MCSGYVDLICSIDKSAELSFQKTVLLFTMLLKLLLGKVHSACKCGIQGCVRELMTDINCAIKDIPFWALFSAPAVSAQKDFG